MDFKIIVHSKDLKIGVPKFGILGMQEVATQESILRLFNFYSYNTSVVGSRLERFFKVEENIFCFQNAVGYP
jgi:hypothetical protein